MPELPSERLQVDPLPEALDTQALQPAPGPGVASSILSALAVVAFAIGLGALVEWRSAPPPPPPLPTSSSPIPGR